MRSFFILLGYDSSLFDLDFLDVLSEATFNCLDDGWLVGLEGIKISASSYFEFGDFSTLLDEDSYIDE